MKSGWANGWRGIFALALLAGAAPTRAQAPQGTSVAGVADEQPKIAAIRIVKEDGQVLSDSPSGIAVETGKALDRRKIGDSLRALYRTGDYADLRAVVTPVADGVRLDFVVRENLFFNQVRIEGLTAPPSDASAAAAMQLALGQAYRQTAVNEALERLQETFRDEGLYQAEVSGETVPHPETHQMDIVVHVKPGPRARVSIIQLKNGTEYRDAEILSRLKMKVGGEITSARLHRGTDRIRKYLVKKGHLSGRAAVRRGNYNVATNTIPLDVEVTEGPRVEVNVTGAKFSKGELKKLIPIYQEGAVDTDLLEEGTRNVRERLERRGYFDTEVLRSRLQIFGGAFGSAGRFSRRLVDSDAQSMRSLYQANGFLDAKVEQQIEDDYKGKEGDLFIRFVVQEGKQTRVASLSIEGNRAFKEEELLGVVGSTPGQPYSDFGVTTDRDNILALYFNEGFPEASFAATAERVSAGPAAQKADGGGSGASTGEKGEKAQKEKESKPAIEQAEAVRLVYHIQEGPQTRVRRILIGGY